MLRPDEGRALSSRPFIWLRVDLRPEIAAPVGVTVRLAHTHIDSAHNLYAGMAFDFTHNMSHRHLWWTCSLSTHAHSNRGNRHARPGRLTEILTPCSNTNLSPATSPGFIHHPACDEQSGRTF